MNAKLFVLTLIAVLTAGLVFGQESAGIPTNDKQPSTDNLQIIGNRKYYINKTQITRTEALALVAPYTDVAAQIQKGVKLRRTAMGVGFAGLGVALVGASLFFGELGSPDPMFRNEAGFGIGIATMSIGGAMGLSSIGIGIAGRGAQKKAMRLYNGYVSNDSLSDYGTSRDAMYLSLTPTPCGLGLQLRF